MPPPKDETEEQKAIRLAKAKKNASKAREEAMIAKYKDKVLAKEKERLKESAPPNKASASRPAREKDEDDDDEEEPVEEVEEEEEPKPKQRLKGSAPPKKASASRPARSKIVIEQSSSDEDTFEPTKDVIFVKRIRAKPKAEAVVAPPPTPAPSPAPAPVTAPVMPPQPRPRLEAPPNPQIRTAQQQQQQRPALTPEQRLEMERYINMTKGVFLPQNPHRR